MLSHLQIPFEFITPRRWQAAIFDLAKKLENTKKQSYDMASRLFPGQELKTKRGKILDGRCDALLIAEVLRRRHIHAQYPTSKYNMVNILGR